MSGPLLGVRELSKSFAARPAPHVALERVTFALERGEALGVVGESGSGKTTLARLIVGLERASAGSIQLDGVELTGLAFAAWRPLRRRVQLVFQDPLSALDPRQTALAAVVEPLALHRVGKPRERRLRALAQLDAVGLAARQSGAYPHELSGGQRQRVGLARALALEPELLVLDEPVSALDVSLRAQVLNLLHELQERLGLAYLFIAHDLAVVRALCARVAVLQRGRLVELASRDELFAHPQHEYTRALLASAPRAGLTSER